MDEKITIKPKGSLSLNKQRPELSIDGLPALIQNYINAVCNIYHCPREFVTTAVLATVSTAIGKKVVVLPKTVLTSLNVRQSFLTTAPMNVAAKFCS